MKNIKKSKRVPKGSFNKNTKGTKNTVTTKNAKYVFINEKKLDNAFSKIKNSMLKHKKSLENGIFKSLKNVDLPNWIQKFKPQIANTVCIAATSLVILTGFSMCNSMFSDNNTSAFYSAKSYTVYLNNEQVGTIRDKETLNSAINEIQEELENKYKSNINIVGNIEVVESRANDSELTSEINLYSKMRSKVDFKSVAYAVVVNSKQIGAVATQFEANTILDDVKEYFTKSYNEEDILEISLDEDVTIEEVNVNFDEIMEKDKLLEYIIVGTDEKISYTVEPGDTYWDIAIKHGMSVEELMAANPDADENKLMPGDDLSLVVPKPFINVNIKHTVIAEEKN
jgi:LysM repeat protein